MSDTQNYASHTNRDQEIAPESAKRNKLLIVGLVLLFIIVASGAYYLGTKNNTTNTRAINIQPTPIDSSIVSQTGFSTYRYLVPDIARAEFQVEIPNDWSVYLGDYFGESNNKVLSIYFGKSHSISNRFVDPVYPAIWIKVEKNASLASKDPSTWSYDDQGKLFPSYPITEQSSNITVNGLPAKKFMLQGQGNDIETVYLIQGDHIFTFTNFMGDNNVFEHMLSTFKILNLDYI